MFLYWRKRGTYELETLPGDLTQLELGAVERFSWSSALDIIEDLEGRYSHFPLRTWRSCGCQSLWHVLLKITFLWWCGVPLESHHRRDRAPNVMIGW